MTTSDTADHAALMDATYRYQRRIYDVTRRWYLLGRDLLVAELGATGSARVLEVACGTGRNLDLVARLYPGARLHGLDISDEMLRSARARMGGRAALVRADACRFRGTEVFGVPEFDRIVLSYAVSMIPDWEGAIGNALDHLAPGGALHIVDFHDQARLPAWFGAGLRAWLARFHVTPRTELAGVLARLCADERFAVRHRSIYRGYAQIAVVTRAC